MEIPWDQLKPKHRDTLTFMIGQNDFKFQAGDVFPMSFPQFKQLISGAYSDCLILKEIAENLN